MHRGLVRLSLAASAALSVASPALADVTAEYVGENERERTVIEVAANGDVRVSDGTDSAGGYMLLVDGEAYSVEPGPGGPLVTASEVTAYETRRGVQAGEIQFSFAKGEPPRFLRFVPGEAIELAGYRGTEYVAEQGEYLPVGIADDEALAPLGRAYLLYEMAIDEMDAGFGVVPDNLDEVLAGRGIIRFWGRDLRRISFAPIDPARFALPAEPLLLEDVLENEGPASRADDDGKFDPIVRAVYFDRAVWTLSLDGKLSRWAEGAETGVVVEMPAQVGAVCRLGKELLVVTGSTESAGAVRLWSGTVGTWREETAFPQSPEGPFLALDCSGDEPLLLTANALLMPRSGRKIAINPETLAPGGYFTTLRHGGYLYVGANAGEWGGGLRRFSLAGQGSELLDASDPDDLCGGALNVDCDPVTGMAPDPGRPDCILASVGLVHFLPSGQVVRVCEGRITIAYRKPYTLDPDWETKPSEEEPFASVPFYAMISAEGLSWAVASDGLYTFSGRERPAFLPFGRTKRLPASGIDWSDPRFVLVATDMNQRHSLSGGSLLLVPR